MLSERVLATIWRQTRALASAIEARDFLLAWSECRELQRVLAHAEACSVAIPVRSGRNSATHRLHAIRSLALPMIDLAPSPSESALQQARSSNWKIDREQWNHEEQQWLAACEANPRARRPMGNGQQLTSQILKEAV
jgi:hypothetical protein